MQQRSAAIPLPAKPGLSFAGFRLESDGTLLRGEAAIHLPPKELAALRLLLSSAGRIVTTIELRQALWGEVNVTEDSVPKCMSSLRARLQPEDCIQTIYKRGYRFTPDVRTSGAASGRSMPRLALLPFTTGYGVPEHLGSVLAEETTARLTNARPVVVLVLAQDSVFTLAQRGLTAQQVGQALNADLALTGSISALPLHYRLRVELVRVADGVQLWVEDLLVDRNRIAGLEVELGNRLAYRLGTEADWAPTLLPVQPALDASLPPVDEDSGLSIAAVAEQPAVPEPGNSASRRQAYDIFQHAHYEWRTLQRHRMQDGLQHLLRATELDPALLDARVDLANLAVAQCLYGFMSPATEAEIIHRTVSAVPGFPARAENILPAVAWMNFHFDRDLAAALQCMELCARLPHGPWVTRVRSMLALSRHRFADAIFLLREAIDEDPYSPWLQARLAWSLHLAGEAAESVQQARRALHTFPEHEGTSLYGALILAHNGESAQAVQLAHDLEQRLPYFDLATSAYAYTLARAGRCDEAQFILERLQWLGHERFLLKSFLPAVYLELGQPEPALAELRAAEESRCPWFFLMLADPRLKPLHGHPEFESMRSVLPRMEADAAGSAEMAS